MALKGILAGQRAWLVQRLSAVYLLAYGLAVTLYIGATGLPTDYTNWRTMLTTPWLWTATALAFVALLFHAWIGIRDVILDYIKPFPLRLLALTLTGLALLACAIWILRLLLPF